MSNPLSVKLLKCIYLFILPIFLEHLVHADFVLGTEGRDHQVIFILCSQSLMPCSANKRHPLNLWNILRAPKQQLNKIALLFVIEGQYTTSVYITTQIQTNPRPHSASDVQWLHAHEGNDHF